MTATELMREGINLMLSGMGFVLLFLFILIFAIRLMSTVVNRLFPETQKPAAGKSRAAIAATADETEALRPIIVAAIAHHRRQCHR
ncbi:oxaloacetate decarboxylase gamma chain [Chelonobacter oris]|uniref:Probable oxaloacetate decarboxylase gamma chain n=1 Tax=Chelonobacter oris TaxID=505317 RepID=A0A0A3AR55_9PAST|nr:oxaloacetate decarboxylase subunit gamma [Chelonobacter oris]KGQ70217.1 oxaloacetate decarboxylase gamma chain [Chelonobacter oris]MDH2999709.1 oxaloacetate decarboxylase gamma chain [Chelonobacter oris]